MKDVISRRKTEKHTSAGATTVVFVVPEAVDSISASSAALFRADLRVARVVVSAGASSLRLRCSRNVSVCCAHVQCLATCLGGHGGVKRAWQRSPTRLNEGTKREERVHEAPADARPGRRPRSYVLF